MSKNILFIVGSNRKGSFNAQVANYIATQLEEKGFATNFLNYSEVPLFNQDNEFPAPNVVEDIRSQVKEADALWIVSAEYNGSIPGYLKNTLDWISRPVTQGTFGAPDFVSGKPITVSGAAGKSESALVRSELVGLLNRMAFKVFDKTAGIAIPGEAWGSGVIEFNRELTSDLDAQIESFIEFIK